MFMMNSKRQLAHYFSDAGWHRITYTLSGEPSYAGRSVLSWRAFEVMHRVLPRELGTSLLAFFQRRVGGLNP